MCFGPGAPRPREDRWIAAWEFRPADGAVVQQAEFWIATGTYLGNWVPPEKNTVLPSGVGQLLPAGSKIVLKVEAGAGSLALYFAKSRPEHRLRTLRLCQATQMSKDVNILAVRPLDSMEITAFRPDGTAASLGLFRDVKPGYLATYRFRNPVKLPRGTPIEMTNREDTKTRRKALCAFVSLW